MTDIVHVPVMSREVLEYLAPEKNDALLVDCTMGEGGHSELFLQKYPDLKVVGLDADAAIQDIAKKRLAPYAPRVRFFNTWFNLFFKDYPLGGERPNLILFDLGISVFHFEKGERGFTFRADEPLDMRLDTSLETTAADIVNEYPEEQLANILYHYGEERYSRRIAAAVVRARAVKPLASSKALEEVIWKAVPDKYRRGRIHPATRCFQALRIAVNGELARLEQALEYALRVLAPGGRMGVISFHSLEDRIVKHFFLGKNKTCTCPEDWPMCKCEGEPIVSILTKKPLVPDEEEKHNNPPSRSAKFRVARKMKEWE
ncbi:16S rRNA (cytosine(1402)-N(4))-methyltransferase RsmH [Marispirochaeta aestuarii]|uniref:16S rRNA (cytosine(1402)-N(4))-methyltransferase RsmH n=1 Tax=Marispirochaeta aestuarii TaxID=1963862 RepID=UPI0029C87912|nr:16S rRNA (cytosine(1402)-N(4))-methyltransferase RsmH [Marispirochaeta aestuarii]